MIASLAELPFPRLPPAALLNFDERGEPLSDDFSAYGYASVPRLSLESTLRPATIEVADALVLGLHAWDDAEPRSDDVELGFWVDERRVPGLSAADDEDVVLVAMLSRFLAVRAIPLLSLVRPAAVVLALCNGYRARVSLPEPWPDLPLWYATGVVTSFAARDPTGRVDLSRLGLSAEAWHRAGARA